MRDVRCSEKRYLVETIFGQQVSHFKDIFVAASEHFSFGAPSQNFKRERQRHNFFLIGTFSYKIKYQFFLYIFFKGHGKAVDW